MKFKVGDVIYEGGGNGVFYTFIKGEIIEIAGVSSNQYYKVKVLEDYGSLWESKANKTAMPGTVSNCIEKMAFTTYDEAKAAVYRDINFTSDREFIANYLNR